MLVVEAMLAKAGVSSIDTAAKVVIIVAAVVVQFVVPFLGHATIKTVLRYLSFVFIAIFVIMAILVLPNVHLVRPAARPGWWLWTTALVLIVSPGGLGWTGNARRLLPLPAPGDPQGQTFWAATLGPAIPSILLELLGVAAYLVSTNVGSLEVVGIPSAFAAHADWFFWPFLIVAILQLFSINTLDMYSSGVTLQASASRSSAGAASSSTPW